MTVLTRRDSAVFLWTAFDQVLSSISNVLISLALARSSGAEGLGVFTAVFAGYLVALGFQRSLIGEPVLALADRPRESIGKEALTLSLSFAVGVGLLSVLSGVALSIPILVVFGPVLVFALGQDLMRHEMFRRRQPRTATLLDAIWALTSAAGFGLVVGSGTADVAAIVWGVGAAIGLLVGMALRGIWPISIPRAFRWWKAEARRLGSYLTLESLVYFGADGLATIAIASLLGPVGLGELKAAEIVLAPGFLALQALNYFLVPRLSQAGSSLLEHAIAPSVAAALGGIILMFISVIAAPHMAQFLYDGMIEVQAILLLPLAVRIVVAASGVGAAAVLKVSGQGRAMVAARVGWALIGLPVVLLLLANFGLIGAAWGSVLQNAVYSVILWIGINRTSNRNIRDPFRQGKR
jgi:O-antigen/teichoic acid export membrane protein